MRMLSRSCMYEFTKSILNQTLRNLLESSKFDPVTIGNWAINCWSWLKNQLVSNKATHIISPTLHSLFINFSLIPRFMYVLHRYWVKTLWFFTSICQWARCIGRMSFIIGPCLFWLKNQSVLISIKTSHPLYLHHLLIFANNNK